MGFSRGSPYYISEEQQKLREASIKSARTKARNKLANKIVTVCIDTTINQIIRPGPKPEERECYEMADELRTIKQQMIELVSEVLRISYEED